MNDNINKYGLKRFIEADKKQIIRKRCGFGCIFCGALICEYEHVEPTFTDSKFHDIEKIALLCPTCHSKVTKGIIAKSTVLNQLKNPFCIRNGFSKESLPAFNDDFYIKFAGATFINCQTPIEINDKPLFSIKKSKENNLILFSGTFYDENGKVNLSIIDNELTFSNNSWDIEQSGKYFIFRKSKGDQQLRLKIDAQNGIIVERIKMRHGLYFFDGNKDNIEISYLNIQKISMMKTKIENCRVGLSLNCNITKLPSYSSIRMLLPVLTITKTGINF